MYGAGGQSQYQNRAAFDTMYGAGGQSQRQNQAAFHTMYGARPPRWITSEVQSCQKLILNQRNAGWIMWF